MLKNMEYHPIEWEEVREMHWDLKRRPGAGCWAPVDANDNPTRIPADVQENPDDYGEGYIFTYDQKIPGWVEGTCVCGATVEMDSGSDGCCERCYREYNYSGQELAPRSQWEDYWDEDSVNPYNVEFDHI